VHCEAGSAPSHWIVRRVREALGRGQGPQANDAVQQLGQLLDACSLSTQMQQPQNSAAPHQHAGHLQPQPRRPQQLPAYEWQHHQLHPGRPPGTAAAAGMPLQQQGGQQQQVDSITAGLRDAGLHQRPPALQMVCGRSCLGMICNSRAKWI
jgi:hypothetical protein